MATTHEADPADQTAGLSDESRGLRPWGEEIRNYVPAPNARWRFGLPDYARTNQLYFQHRSRKHAAGSLEAVVQKVIKSWEVESHHVSDYNTWSTVDVRKFVAHVNGESVANTQMLFGHGHHNVMIGETKEYSARSHSIQSTSALFDAAFPQGFAWEVLEVLSGPPAVTMKWRHFGVFSGSYADKQGNKFVGDGRMVNIYGVCIAKVNDDFQIEALEVYYDPSHIFEPLTSTKSSAFEDSSPVFDPPPSRRSFLLSTSKEPPLPPASVPLLPAPPPPMLSSSESGAPSSSRSSSSNSESSTGSVESR